MFTEIGPPIEVLDFGVVERSRYMNYEKVGPPFQVSCFMVFGSPYGILILYSYSYSTLYSWHQSSRHMPCVVIIDIYVYKCDTHVDSCDIRT